MKKKIKSRKNKNLHKINHGNSFRLHMNSLIEKELISMLKDTSNEKKQGEEEQWCSFKQQQRQVPQKRQTQRQRHQQTASAKGKYNKRIVGGWYFNVPSVFEVAVSKLADKLDVYDPMLYSLY